MYSTLRLLLLVVVGGLAYAAGMRGLLLLIAAFLGSGLLSFFVLRGPRTQFGTDIRGVFKRIDDRIDAATRAEDAEVLARSQAGVSQAGVGMKPTEEQVDPEVVEPEHHKS